MMETEAETAEGTEAAVTDRRGEHGMEELGHDDVLKALERALVDNPRLRKAPIEELARQLLLGGYLKEEPSLGLVGTAMATIVAEEQAFGPDVPLEEL